jgi:phosphorylated CTD-interacting factor 1
MSFVVVVPAWRDAEAWRALDASPFNRRVLVVARDEHGFCDGAAHQRRDRYRDSPYDTALFFLQNDAGAAQWPASDGALDAVRRAMALALPTAAMRKRQKRDGRGTHDEMRGAYKGKKSNANGAVGVRARKKAEGAEALRVRKRAKEREKKKRAKRRKYLAAHPDAVPLAS